MKRLLACAVFLLPGLVFSQGIRKNFSEMTSAEKSAYMSALVSLYNGDPNQDIVQDLENNYWYYYDDIYGDLSGTPCESNTYLPWNRATLWEMENALQRQNPRLTIPYWDFTVNNSPTDSIFTFLNENDFPAAWGIQWYQGGSPLPTTSQVQAMQNSTQFCDDNNYSNSYNDQMLNTMDADIQYWVGGSVGEDGDPMYMVYHAMLDKLWQQWQTKTGATAPFANALDRYDGVTTSPYFSPLPLIGSNSDTDARTDGIFYSNNDTATLNGGYTVTNTYMTPEYYSYPNQIVVGNFNVPSGNSAVIVTQSGVTINPGFTLNGSMEIDVGSNYYNNFPLAKSAITRQNTFEQPSSNSGASPEPFSLIRSGQGFTARVWLENPSEVEGYLMTVDGKIVSRVAQAQHESGYSEFQLNVPQGGALYIAYFRVGDQTFKQMLPRF